MVHAAYPTMRGRSKAVSLLAIMLVLSGCSMRPEPLTHDEHVGRARQDMLTLFSKYRPIEKDLTLSDALARGLIDNLDHRLALMEQVLEQSRLSLVQYDMLPRLAAEAGYDWRDRENASTSISLLTGTPSLQPSYSSEREGVDASLRMSWNVLDFGLGYFQAKQQSDRVLIAVETRRRVINNTTRDIISAYYRALAAEKLLPRVRRGIADTQKAIAASDKARSEQLVPAAQMLSYKRDLLQYALTLRNHEIALQRSREELATLINVPADQLRLAHAKAPQLPKISPSIMQLQDYALVNRAELREEAYRERIDRQSVHQETLRLFPGLSAITSLNYDDNTYLYYSHWREMGLRATWNLLDVLKAYKGRQIAEAQVEYTQLRRVALSAAVLAQTAISYYQYQEARSTNRTAAQLSDVESQLLKAARDAEEAQSGSVLERMRQQTASISAQIEADRSYADAQTALASLLVSVGYDFVPASIDATDPDALSADIAPALAALEKGSLPSLNTADKLLPQVPVSADGVSASRAMIDAAKAEVATNEASQKKGFWASLFSTDPKTETVPASEPAIAPRVLTKAEKSQVILDAWRNTQPVAEGAVAPHSSKEAGLSDLNNVEAAVAPVAMMEEARVTEEIPSQNPGFFKRFFGAAPVAPPAEDSVVAVSTPEAADMPLVNSAPVEKIEIVPPAAREVVEVEKVEVVPAEVPPPAVIAPEPEVQDQGSVVIEAQEAAEQKQPAVAKPEPKQVQSAVPTLNVREADVSEKVVEKTPPPVKTPEVRAEPQPKATPKRVAAPVADSIAPPPSPTERPAMVITEPTPAPVIPARASYIPANRAQQLEEAEIKKYTSCQDGSANCGDPDKTPSDKE